MNYTVNITDIESALRSLGGEAKTRDIQDRVLQICCGGEIPTNYKDERTFRQTIQDQINRHCPQDPRFDALKSAPKFSRIGFGLYRGEPNPDQDEFRAIEEVADVTGLLEGAVRGIYVNTFERNPIARRDCIRHHGWSCKVCEFDFEMAYGDLGRDFIHVHHVKPLSEIKSTYRCDPKKDLVPLCPNCHAMIHRAVPPLSVEQLKERYNSLPDSGNRTRAAL